MEQTQPFAGIRVLDLTHVLAGPFATYQLGVLGADVIKVENPNDPDMAREWGPEWSLNHAQMGTAFLTQGANKRAIALDLTREEDRDILRNLADTADVFAENYRPGALEELGLGYEALMQRNPRLIYASMSAFGQEGERREMTAFDYVIQATSGLMAMTGTPEVNPVKFGSPAVDYATGTMGAFAISSALLQRERTGVGQHIDMAMMDVAMVLMSLEVSALTRSGVHPTPHGNSTVHATCNNYETRDGNLVMLGASNMKQYRRLWRALDRPDVIKPDYETRIAAFDEEEALLREIMVTRTAGEWETFLQGKHVPAARVRPLAEAMSDPHLAHRQVLGEIDDESIGHLNVPLTAFRFAHGGGRINTPPPRVGQHTAEILREAGYDEGQISDFLERGDA